MSAPLLARRIAWLGAAIALGVLGVWLRFHAPIPDQARDSSGGVVYVVFWIFVAAFLAPATRPALLALIVLITTCILEFLQLWHPYWLEQIRATFIGRCVLGTTFGWADFPPYFGGAIIGWGILRMLAPRRAPAAAIPAASRKSGSA